MCCPTTPPGAPCYNLCFTDEETKAESASVFCQKLHAQQVAELEFDPKQFDVKLGLFAASLKACVFRRNFY